MSAALQPTDTDAPFSTRLFGQIVIPPELHLVFDEGIPGFPGAHRFAMLQAATPALCWLQSLDDPALAFLLVRWAAVSEPFDTGGLDAFAIVTLPGVDRPATANLQAPILIHAVRRSGRQTIRTDATPGTSVPIDLEALARLG